MALRDVWNRYRPSAQLKKVLASCVVGNALEWYDFVLYGYFAHIIGQQILPPDHDPVAALLKTYGIFFLGFLMRPLGGIVFGYIGDHWGRKKALMLSLYGMAVPTVLIGCIPTYAQVGLWAPACLMILRSFQGLSMGGEFTGAMVFMVEHAPEGQKGFWGSWATSSVVMGSIAGSLMAMGLSWVCEGGVLAAWGWRIPFWLSAGGGVMAWYMRRHVQDSQHHFQDFDLLDQVPDVSTLVGQSLHHTTFQRISCDSVANQGGDFGDQVRGAVADFCAPFPLCLSDQDLARQPEGGAIQQDVRTAESLGQAGQDGWPRATSEGTIKATWVRSTQRESCQSVVLFFKQMFQGFAKRMVSLFFMDMVVAVGFFMVCVYIMNFLQTNCGCSYRFAAASNTFSMGVFGLAIPLAGLAADRWGCVRTMRVSVAVLGGFACVAFVGFGSQVPWIIFGCQALLALAMGGVFAPVPAILVHALPAHVRYTGISLAHNLSMTLFGGSTPEIATVLIRETGWSLMPGLWLALAAGVSWFALGILQKGMGQRETKNDVPLGACEERLLGLAVLRGAGAREHRGNV